MQNAKPALVSGGIEIVNWRAYTKNSLRGFVDVKLASGLIIRDISIHERNGAEWIAMPGKLCTNEKGEATYACILKFVTRDRADAFRDQVLSALDAYLVVAASRQ